MFVEVKGIGLPNRGAELMLIAVMQQFEAHYGKNCRFVLAPESPYEERVKHPVYQKFTLKFKGVDLSFLGRLIPKKIRQRFGLILDSEIDVVLDASGFAYSDQWGWKKAKSRAAGGISKWRKNGKKVIFLPQAFGPFKEQALRECMSIIIKNANLIFCRDSDSHRYMQSVLEKDSLLQAPDFTNLVSAHCPKWFLSTAKDVCFIPNSKMIEKGGDHVAGYVNFFVELIAVCQDKGMRPFLLLHEGRKDLELCEKVNDALNTPIDLIQTTDALEIKGIIGSSQAVVSSRFHGLVSALSQGRPVLATGWSHKYKMLLKDYGCDRFCITTQDLSKAKILLEELIDVDQNVQWSRSISTSGELQKNMSIEMWEKVFSEIDGL